MTIPMQGDIIICVVDHALHWVGDLAIAKDWKIVYTKRELKKELLLWKILIRE